MTFQPTRTGLTGDASAAPAGENQAACAIFIDTGASGRGLHFHQRVRNDGTWQSEAIGQPPVLWRAAPAFATIRPLYIPMYKAWRNARFR